MKNIEKVFKQKLAFKEDVLVLKMARNNSDKTHFNFLVSKKVSKKASVRNKIRRRLREIVRAKLPRLKKGFDIAFIAIPGLENKSFQGLEGLADKLFLKAKLFND